MRRRVASPKSVPIHLNINIYHAPLIPLYIDVSILILTYATPYFPSFVQTIFYFKINSMMTYDFTSFSTVFQSYQDDGRLIMKGCVLWSFFCG